MPTATVTSKGQVTIPVEVRNRMGLKAGTRLDFIPLADGTFQLFAATGSVLDLAGILYEEGRSPSTVDEEDEAVGAYLAKKHGR